MLISIHTICPYVLAVVIMTITASSLFGECVHENYVSEQLCYLVSFVIISSIASTVLINTVLMKIIIVGA